MVKADSSTASCDSLNEPLLSFDQSPLVAPSPCDHNDGQTVLRAGGDQSSGQASINLAKAFLGAATFAMPWAFQQAGLMAGSIGVALVAFLSYVTIKMLTDSKRVLQESGFRGAGSSLTQDRQLDYADMAKITLGDWSGPLITILTCASCLGACAADVTFISGVAVQIIPGATMWSVVSVLFPVFVALSWLRSFSQLSLFSTFGTLMFLVGVIVVFNDGFTHHEMHTPWEYSQVRPSTFLLFFGPSAFLFSIHYCAVPIESEMRTPRHFPRVLGQTVGLCAIMNIAVGALGFMLYSNAAPVLDSAGNVLEGCTSGPVCDQILKNLAPGLLKTLVVVPIALNLMMTYLVLLAPVRDYFEKMLVQEGVTRLCVNSAWQRNVIRLVLVAFTFWLALEVGSFGIILAFVGSISDCILAMILPPLIYLKAHDSAVVGSAARAVREHVMKPTTRGLCIALSCFGVAMMLLSTWQNIVEVIEMKSA